MKICPVAVRALRGWTISTTKGTSEVALRAGSYGDEVLIVAIENLAQSQVSDTHTHVVQPGIGQARRDGDSERRVNDADGE